MPHGLTKTLNVVDKIEKDIIKVYEKVQGFTI